jgi:hypothetical protein
VPKVISNLLCICIAALIFTSCYDSKKNDAANSITVNPKNIILFFLDSLQHHDLRKIVSINGQSDTVIMAHADWIKEMDFLEAVNTNKPAYKGALRIDTSRNADTLIYHLTCTDKKLNLQEAYIHYHHNQLVHMTLNSFGSNFLFKNAKEIYFNPLKGYYIKGFQQLDLLSNHEVAYTIMVNKM